MIVAYLSLERPRRHDISRSDKPCGRSSNLSSKDDRIANPTPASLLSPSGFPFQKKVYPGPLSTTCPSSLNLVSDKAAISILYRSSSLATSAVRLSGRLDEFRSRSVLTFQQDIESGTFFLCLCVSVCGVHFSAVAAIFSVNLSPHR